MKHTKKLKLLTLSLFVFSTAALFVLTKMNSLETLADEKAGANDCWYYKKPPGKHCQKKTITWVSPDAADPSKVKIGVRDPQTDIPECNANIGVGDKNTLLGSMYAQCNPNKEERSDARIPETGLPSGFKDTPQTSTPDCPLPPYIYLCTKVEEGTGKDKKTYGKWVGIPDAALPEGQDCGTYPTINIKDATPCPPST